MEVIGSSNKPVIISSSLSSLLISLSLSRKGINHFLIHRPNIGGSVKVGESINQTASLDFWKFLGPEFEPFFCTKNHISLLKGDTLSLIYLGNPNREKSKKKVGKSFFRFISTSLVHVNRTKLEEKLFEKVVGSKYCSLVEGSVAEVSLNPQKDIVERIEIVDNGEKKWLISPSFVFDGSGKKSKLRLAAGVIKKVLSTKELVIWSQIKKNTTLISNEWWGYGTNLLRLEEEYDGVSGIAWLIPVANYYSIGMSLKKGDEVKQQEKEVLLARLIQSFQQRGIEIKLDQSEYTVQSFEHEYYCMDRAFGVNWLLAGSSFISIWFPSSAGVAVGMTAAHVAPYILKEVDKYGEYYQASLMKFIPFHWHIDGMVKEDKLHNNNDLFEFWKQWISPLPNRLISHIEDHYAKKELAIPAFYKKVISSTVFINFLMPYSLIRVVKKNERNTMNDYFSPIRLILRNVMKNIKLKIL